MGCGGCRHADGFRLPVQFRAQRRGARRSTEYRQRKSISLARIARHIREHAFATADPIGGLINYDWKSFETAPNERIKATVYILDTRLRADGVKVSVFRQEKNESGEWVDVSVDPETALQLENKILDRARLLKNSQLSNQK